MLVDKSELPKAGDIVVFMTAARQEVVAKFVASEAGVCIVQRPLALVLHARGEEAQVGFAPFMLGIEEKTGVRLRLDNLTVEPIRARNDLTSMYIKATTGLTVPANSGLVV